MLKNGGKVNKNTWVIRFEKRKKNYITSQRLCISTSIKKPTAKKSQENSCWVKVLELQS